ncbi:MAG: CBM9 family sugar-binding protein [Gammaproteobacteria bacterium]|nr:CBM9 family sugar-binding protein [Gammaproteobacteria bacterium]
MNYSTNKVIAVLILILFTFSKISVGADRGSSFTALYSATPITIDGNTDEEVWQSASWHPLFENMLQRPVSSDDFSGQFKLAWDEGFLYIMVEITDDVLFDQHADPLYFYWDDDCLEIFLDEDKSGGEHQFNYNAFAYHVALDNQAVDIGEQTATNKEPFLLLNDHVKSIWKRSASEPHKIIWEVAVKVFDDNFKPNLDSVPVILTEGKELGFMLAYCDNDGSQTRENFIGSTEIKAINGDKNLGYKTADVFASLILVK